jgi:hypothetical protein
MSGFESQPANKAGGYCRAWYEPAGGDWGSFYLLAGNLSPGISGLLQHNLQPIADIPAN